MAVDISQLNDEEKAQLRDRAIQKLKKENLIGAGGLPPAGLLEKEMGRLVDQDQQKAQQAEQESQEQQQEAEAKADQLKRVGLYKTIDPKLAEHALNIFPSLKQFGMKSVDTPMAAEEEETSREPAAVEEEEEQVPDDAIKASILETEGGYSDVEEDKGGATNKGITLETYSKYLGRPASKEELKNISDKDVNAIFGRYYQEVGGDKIKDPKIREILVDQNYNKGTNFLNRINDMLGTPRGTSLSQEAIDKINSADPNELAKQILSSERDIYKKIAEKDPSQQKFSAGWDKRILDLAKKAGIQLDEERMSREPEPKNIEELLKKAREEEDRASNAKQFAELRDAIIGVGAGRVIASDTASYDERKKKAMRPIEDMFLKDELESKQSRNDPNSQISKLMRKSLEQMGISMSGFDKVSYSQLEKLYPSLVSSLYNKIALDTKNQLAKDKLEATKLLKQQEIDKKKKEAAKISDKQLTPISDVDSIIANLDNVISQAKSKFVGPLDARIPDVMTSGEEAAFRSAVGRMTDSYRKAITGAGASAMELQKLESRLPDAKDTIEQFKAKALEFRKELVRNRTTYLTTLRKQGKDVSEFEQEVSEEEQLTPEERLKKYEDMIKRATELQSRRGK
jgi:lysozyme family protein